jgi:uncharacterized membrane protein
MSKMIRLAFLGSLILNVVMIGFFVGQSPRRFDRDARREQRMEQVLQGLSPETQSRIREKFTQLRSAAQPQFDQIRTAQDEAMRILGAERFDEDAYSRQVAKINQLRVETTDRLSKAAKEAALALPPNERRKFAELLRRPRPAERAN